MKMKVELNEKFPIDIAFEGTVMDYVDDEFVFIIKDAQWTDYEIQALHKKQLEVDFVCKYDITLFLITVLDAIDTSDFIFNIHDNEYPESIFDQKVVNCSIYLLDEANVVKAVRHVTLNKDASACIANTLKEVAQKEYHEEEFNCNLEGLQNTWEPFELQEFAVVKETF